MVLSQMFADRGGDETLQRGYKLRSNAALPRDLVGLAVAVTSPLLNPAEPT